jgi:hypothetical protein
VFAESVPEDLLQLPRHASTIWLRYSLVYRLISSVH